MNNFVENCGGRKGCISDIIYACNCGAPVVFLCSGCVINHLSSPGSHLFISLEQARELVKDENLNRRFHESFAKYSILKASIQSYINSLECYKEYIIKSKNEILSFIEQEFETRFEILSDNQRKAAAQLEKLKEVFQNPGIYEDEILNAYETEGLKGVIPDCISSYKIKLEEVQDTIRNAFFVSSSDLLYYTRENSSKLMTYNPNTNTIQDIDLCATINYKFNHSSTCILPDGNVMIVGGYNPYHGDTYKFNTKTHECTQLSPLNYPRGYISLICHNKYLYALGGYSTKRAERMEWSGNGWESLPDMNEVRYYNGVVSIDDRIYLIGGYNTHTIEYYDVRDNTFNLVTSLEVSGGYYFAGRLDDRIYIVKDCHLKVMDKNLSLLEEKRVEGNKMILMFDSAVVKNEKIYFHDSNMRSICVLDTMSKSLTQIMSSYSI